MIRIDYFSQQGFARLFAAVKKKYESLGRIGGSIRLTRLQEEEKAALSGLLGRDLHQNSVSIRLQELEQTLLNSRYETDLLSLLHLLYKGEVKPKSVLQQEKTEAWRKFVDQLVAVAEHEETIVWLEQIREGIGAGYRTLRELYDELVRSVELDEPVETRNANDLHGVIRALDRLPVRFGEVQPLPVFATQISADPHFLDRDRRLGRLFYYGVVAYIAYHSEGHYRGSYSSESKQNVGILHEQTGTSLQVRKQYLKAGLKLDALSSQVLVVDASYQLPLSFAITLETLEQYTPNEFHSHPLHTFIDHALQIGTVYVSENPAICAAVTDFIQKKRGENKDKARSSRDHTIPLLPSLICTSGQPSVAAIRLLDILTMQGVHIHYSGDLDVKGLEMAIALQNRYPKNWHPWGMRAEEIEPTLDHENHTHGTGVLFTGNEQTSLQQLSISWDPRLVDTLLKGGQKIYQEMVVELLVEQYMKGAIIPRH